MIARRVHVTWSSQSLRMPAAEGSLLGRDHGRVVGRGRAVRVGVVAVRDGERDESAKNATSAVSASGIGRAARALSFMSGFLSAG